MTQVKTRRTEDDPTIYDSFAIRAFIRESILALRQVPYDPETGSLPIRPDAAAWASDYLVGERYGDIENGGVLWYGGANMPTLSLERDGTILIRFVEGLRSLTFRVLATRVIISTQTFEDGQTRIDRMLEWRPDADKIELDMLLEWLLEAEE